MRDKVIEHLVVMSQAHRDLVESLPERDLARSLSDRSNTIGAQIWCVVGARESYTRALDAGGWAGFTCSLSGSETQDKAAVLAALYRSETALRDLVASLDWTDTRESLLLDLLEHETQHQGQIIRYLYGLGRRFPESWAGRWSLDQPS